MCTDRGLIGDHIKLRHVAVDSIFNLYFCDRNFGYLDL